MTIVLHLVDKSKNPQIPPLSQTKLKQILLFYFSPIDLIPKEKKKKTFCGLLMLFWFMISYGFCKLLILVSVYICV